MAYDRLEDEDPLLRVTELGKTYRRRALFTEQGTGPAKALEEVTFDLHQGEALGLLGESGSGKTTLARCILGLEKPSEGRIMFRGRRIDSLAGRSRWWLGKKIQLVWQDPYAYLNPYEKVAESIIEPLVNYKQGNRNTRRERLDELLHWVDLPPAVVERYPHELSGGQCQRAVIARALALNPDLLICDEPLSSLDVPTQMQLLELFRKLQTEYDLTYLFIAHDGAQVRSLCSQVAVMHQGRLVEKAPTETLFCVPAHPYTRRLLASASRLGEAYRKVLGDHSNDSRDQE
jgi:ABC-type oligopeptide transport system ATPase subunit